jgi:hypothetical protein
VQVADFANFLEVCYNFCHFRAYRTTIYTLCLFAAISLLSADGDAQFVLKVFWFVVGVVFSVCLPISSLYLQYRLLVSIFKWTFWDVPTHAEWCFQYLQERAVVARDTTLSKMVTTITFERSIIEFINLISAWCDIANALTTDHINYLLTFICLSELVK